MKITQDSTLIARTRRHIFRNTLLLLTAAIVLTSCDSGESTVTPQISILQETTMPLPSPTEVVTPSPSPIPTPDPYKAPLTGLGIEAPITARPIMYMVENSPSARPQTGLTDADVVYEILAEGEITRFIAVYQSKVPAVIGPVRSIRPYFVEIGKGLDAIVVHAGWSQDGMNAIVRLKVDHLDQVYGDDRYYWRDKSRKAPHNLYSNVEKIRQAALDKKFHVEWKNPLLKFTAPLDSKLEGQVVNNITIPYIAGYKVGYTYDKVSGLFQRSMLGEPHKDKVSGQIIEAKNIIICEASHQILDKEGRRAVNIHGPGKGYLLQEGIIKEVTWKEKDGFIRVSDTTGELGLLPGKTWIQVVPKGTELTIT
ncbi:DUF3048 domain-containing protein [Paenibacillus psychroresistens]|uniref:DUF3048 domain-containing protein n=1 Tax=Paenibacillus psychroresistens TaxID=1778678 RepID=UPI0013917C3D|nr:DUF3048 domain-containing protein [Paenibacillus psychroresistens]